MLLRVIILMFTLLVGLCFSKESPCAAEKELRVMTEEFPPFNYMIDKKVEGLSTQILRKLLTKSQLKFEIELVPWKRAYTTALNRPNTLIYTIARTEAREHRFHWIGKISNRKLSLFRLKKRVDLANMTLEVAKKKAKISCLQEDASTDRIIKMGFSRKNLTMMHDKTTGSLMINHVIKGRSDFFPMNPFALKFRIENKNLPDIFKDQFVIYDDDGYYIAANINTDPGMLSILRKTYNELIEDGFIKRTIDDYLSF